MTFASTESQRAEIQERREEFAKEAALIDRDRFVFLDESGSNVAMTPSHRWAPRDHRIEDNKPTNWGKNISVIGAIRTARLVYQRRFKGSVNGPRFFDVIEKTLCPQLQRGDIVVMDNLRAHHIPAVKETIERRRAKAWYLPPHSPDFNPIELLWAFMKRLLRRLKLRDVDRLLAEIPRLLKRVPRQHFRYWFDNCGYYQRKIFAVAVALIPLTLPLRPVPVAAIPPVATTPPVAKLLSVGA
jgi:transposase